MLPQKLAFVDIETSGARVDRDRVIEIGIVRVENGEAVQKYSSLINPQGYVSPYIEQFTGIRKEDLEDAPLFEDIKDTVLELLDGCVFVAHNVRFDYGFLKNEFARYDYTFSMPHFCTVKLSRHLYPQFPRHNLDALIERFQFPCSARHRALGDAEVLWQFYRYVQDKFPEEELVYAVNKGLRRPSLPPRLGPQVLKQLPQGPGVYIFYDEKDYPLYIGKSKHIRERVLSHFNSDYTSSREMQICQQTARIETISTAGELGALLREAQLVKDMQPLYNRKLRKTRKLIVAKKIVQADGYEGVMLETLDAIAPEEGETILSIFKSQKQAKDFLLEVAKSHQLCHKLLGLEKTKGSCFGYQLNTCKGACLGEETPITYNFRFLNAFLNQKLRPWPYSGPILVNEHDPLSDHHEAFVIDKWRLLGRYSEDQTINPLDEPVLSFDLDAYKILVRYLYTHDNMANIQPFQQEKLQFIS